MNVETIKLNALWNCPIVGLSDVIMICGERPDMKETGWKY